MIEGISRTIVMSCKPSKLGIAVLTSMMICKLVVRLYFTPLPKKNLPYPPSE